MKSKIQSFLSVALPAVMIITMMTACGAPKDNAANDSTSSATGPAVSSNSTGSSVSADSSAPQNGDKITVVASFYPVYDFASKIGGDKVTVKNLVPAGTEPHDWEPAPSDITSLEHADVFVYSGAGMESWVTKVLGTLDNKNLVVAEASKGLTLRKWNADQNGADAKDADKGEHEGTVYDPHVWLAPENAKQEMKNIETALIKADPKDQSYFEDNYKTWSAKCDQLDQEYRDTLSALPNKAIVVSHEAFGYLCDAYGLKQMGISGISPDVEPDPARMAEIQDFVKANHVKVIFSEDLVSPKVAQSIAKATGAKMELLNPLEGLTDEELAAGDDYFSVMRQNLDTLKSALQ